MADAVLKLTCPCGATLHYEGARDRAADQAHIFTDAHAKCREIKPVKLLGPSDTPPAKPDLGDDNRIGVGTIHAAPTGKFSLGFTTPGTDPWKWGNQ